MSHVPPPIQFLEKAFDGLHDLLKLVYFNDNVPQNRTVRINMYTKTAEIYKATEWKPIALPEAASKMIEKCGNYMFSAFNAEKHMTNDQVMDFGCSMHNPGEGKTAFLQSSIHHELLQRARS